MIIQPYLENAIIHGLLNLDSEREGKLTMLFSSTDNGVSCIIEDNGVGRKRASEIKLAKGKTHESKGMAITANRIRLISRLYAASAKAEITDLYDERNEPCGTRVTIVLPIIDPA
jgi:LytS/YehU family sensor histidine kinase